ncbi:MAG: hypothetical protein K8W52_46115 [Deltaproteobacteria bacterium]|nr:hypothetical protein [Deltaproteobacteria bacterium]
MKNLVLSALVFGAGLLATGCELTTISPSWQLQDWNDQTETVTAASCRTDSNTIKFYALPAGDTNPDNAITDLFNCTDGSGTTADLPADSYTTWVELTSDDNAILYAQSGSVPVSVSAGGDAPVDFAFQANRGYTHASWSLMQGGTATSCSAHPDIAGIEFLATGTGAALTPDTFDCADLQGTTFPQPIDTYTLHVGAINSANPPLELGAAADIPNLKVQYGNQLVEAGALVIDLF